MKFIEINRQNGDKSIKSKTKKPNTEISSSIGMLLMSLNEGS